MYALFRAICTTICPRAMRGGFCSPHRLIGANMCTFVHLSFRVGEIPGQSEYVVSGYIEVFADFSYIV